jgi:hypothetical protein
LNQTILIYVPPPLSCASLLFFNAFNKLERDMKKMKAMHDGKITLTSEVEVIGEIFPSHVGRT